MCLNRSGRSWKSWLPLMPDSVKPMKEILSFVLDSWTPVVGKKNRIAVVGPANVGKSTLFNQLVQKKEDLRRRQPGAGHDASEPGGRCRSLQRD